MAAATAATLNTAGETAKAALSSSVVEVSVEVFEVVLVEEADPVAEDDDEAADPVADEVTLVLELEGVTTVPITWEAARKAAAMARVIFILCLCMFWRPGDW